MKTIWPDYYSRFNCIGSSCKHTCCAGWEIDVDENSLRRFKTNPDVYKHVKDESIVLVENERCPFLCDNGLCQMILDYGEDYLCDICSEHPRFYVDCIDHYEGGIGLVCEEACRIVLDYEKDFMLEDNYPLPEEIQLIFNRSNVLSFQMDSLCNDVWSSVERAKFFLNMEILDETWPSYLHRIKEFDITKIQEDELINNNRRVFSNFLAYLLYRQRDAVNFAIEATRLLADLVIIGMEIHEAARMFSGEIEYSDENVDKAYDI
ncbi:MAG: flagellin lysine-N-methylase [Saccharofermentans sp.]|nr:flagellin lysine-N-methylase [Saccharofermentans sp.]